MTSLPLPDGGGPALDPNAPVYGDPRIGRPQAPNFRGGAGRPGMPNDGRGGFGRPDMPGRPDWNGVDKGPKGPNPNAGAGGALSAAHQAWRDARPENPMRDWHDSRPERPGMPVGATDWRAQLEQWRATRPDMGAYRDALGAWRDQRPQGGGIPRPGMPVPQVSGPPPGGYQPPPSAPVPQVSAQPPGGGGGPNYAGYGQGPGHRWAF